MADDPKRYSIQAQFDLFKEESLTAVTSLATASSTATEFGHHQLAQATEGVQYVFIKEFYNAPNFDAITQSAKDKLSARVQVVEAQVTELQQQRQEPTTRSGRCQKEFEACRARGADGAHQGSCWISYMICLGQHVTKAAVGKAKD
jgi:hypothetical protein